MQQLYKHIAPQSQYLFRKHQHQCSPMTCNPKTFLSVYNKVDPYSRSTLFSRFLHICLMELRSLLSVFQQILSVASSFSNILLKFNKSNSNVLIMRIMLVTSLSHFNSYTNYCIENSFFQTTLYESAAHTSVIVQPCRIINTPIFPTHQPHGRHNKVLER